MIEVFGANSIMVSFYIAAVLVSCIVQVRFHNKGNLWIFILIGKALSL